MNRKGIIFLFLEISRKRREMTCTIKSIGGKQDDALQVQRQTCYCIHYQNVVALTIRSCDFIGRCKEVRLWAKPPNNSDKRAKKTMEKVVNSWPNFFVRE